MARAAERQALDGLAMDEAKWGELCERLRRARDVGTVTTAFLRVAPGASARAAADEIARAQGFAGLGERWRRIDTDCARKVVRKILGRDLAYGTEIMVPTEAASLAAEWLDLAAPPITVLTNGDWLSAPEEPLPWDPITDATFDAGVVAVGNGIAMLLWVQDED